MHIAAFIGELQCCKNLKLSYLSICEWAISPFLSDQVTYLNCLLGDYSLLYLTVYWLS